MNKVQCSECRKRYDYDEDGFCPYCGTFNQPGRKTGLDESRREGLSEAGHQNSFLHAEFHEENRDRLRRRILSAKENIQQTASVTAKEKTQKANPLAVLPWIVGGIVLLDLLGNVLFMFS